MKRAGAPVIDDLEHEGRPNLVSVNGADGSLGVRLQLLGPIALDVADEPVPLSPQQRRLLAAIAVGPGMSATTAELIDRIWGEEAPPNARKLVQGIVLRIRRTLAGRTTQEHLRTTTIGYELNHVDADRDDFSTAVETSRTIEDHTRRVETLGRALSLWYGPPYGECGDEPWVTVDAARLDALRVEAEERYAAALLALGQEVEAIPLLEAATQTNPLHEPYWELLISALHGSGRKADALDAYQRARSHLVEELGLEPSPTLREIEHAVLVDDDPGPNKHDHEDAPPLDRIGTEYSPIRNTQAPNNLPAARNSFVGRTGELTEVHTRLNEAQLVTLTGVGGSGKTRLAVEAARQRLQEHPDGTLFVDLSKAADSGQVAAAVAEVIGLPSVDRTKTLAEAVVGFLSARAALMVLDNCEHLLDAAADLADAVLESCPQVVVLATSREALEVEGEITYRVPSLESAGEAVALFADRARAVRADFDPDTDPDTVAEICRRLDGLPLAIELAAARIQHLSLTELAARLDDRFRLLTSGRRRTRRQQTLEAVLDWSHDLLDPDEQALLRRLAVFSGSFTLPAAEAACGHDLTRPVVDLLGTIVAKSLVQADPDGVDTRYRLLETVRMYAQDKLVAAGEATEQRDRHRDWYLATTEASPDDPLDLQRGRSPHRATADNLRTAIDWSASQRRWDLVVRQLTATVNVWLETTRTDDARRWLASAIDSGNLCPALQVRAHAAEATLANVVADYGAQQPNGTMATTLSAGGGDIEPRWAALGHTMTAQGQMYALDADAADGSIHRALDLLRAHDLPEVFCRYHLGIVREQQGRFEEAIDEHRWVIDQLEADVIWPVSEIVVLHHLLGNHEAASEFADQLREADEPTESIDAVVAETARAIAELGEGNIDDSIERLLHAFEAARRGHVPVGPERCLVALAYIEAVHGSPEHASLMLGRVEGDREGWWRTPTDVELSVAIVHEVRGHLTREQRHELRTRGQQLTLDEAVALVTRPN